MKKFRLVKILLLGFFTILVLNGCEQSDEEVAEPTTKTVMINQMQFHPAELSINKGDTVIWVNQGIVAHNVTELPKKAWTSNPIKPGQSWKVVINEDAEYYCSIHPTMKGKVIVR